MTTKTVSIRVDSALWQHAKIYAIQKGTDLSELVERLLRKELGEKE